MYLGAKTNGHFHLGGAWNRECMDTNNSKESKIDLKPKFARLGEKQVVLR